jgi:hypothetical protein
VFIASQQDTDPLAHGHAVRAVFTNRAGSAITRPARIVWRTEWMKDLGSDIDNMPLTELTIPGAHDMGTYGINSESPDSTDGQAHLVRWEYIVAMCAASLLGLDDPLDCALAIIAVSPVHAITEHYARAQSATKDATRELNDGIRYFDLRVCGHDDGSANWTSFSSRIVTCHGVEAATLQEILAQTRAWVDAHPPSGGGHFFSEREPDQCSSHVTGARCLSSSSTRTSLESTGDCQASRQDHFITQSIRDLGGKRSPRRSPADLKAAAVEGPLAPTHRGWCTPINGFDVDVRRRTSRP